MRAGAVQEGRLGAGTRAQMPEGLPQKSLRGSHFYPECNGQPPEGFKERSDII